MLRGAGLALRALLSKLSNAPPSWADHADEPCGAPSCGSYLSAPAAACAWDYLSCRDSRVVALAYEGSEGRLVGTLPPEMGSMTALEFLDLGGNHLSSTVPALWSQMTALQTLVLGGNELSGQLPASFDQLHNLTSLSLSFNRFTGAVPASWGDLQQLRELELAHNSLDGGLPEQWGNMTSLNSLRLGEGGRRAGGRVRGGRRSVVPNVAPELAACFVPFAQSTTI